MLGQKYEERIICFDLDGTLTRINNYPEMGEPNEEYIRLVKELDEDYTILISTARSEDYRVDVSNWLTKQGIYFPLYMGVKPVADLYIDDRGLYPDPQILKGWIEMHFNESISEYLEKLAGGEFTSEFAKNIANVPENPDRTDEEDDKFMIYLPISGGLDSITMWQMLRESGMDYKMFYFDFGQPYAELEIETIKEITNEPFEIIPVDIKFKEYKHIMNGRNALIVLLLAERMRQSGEWGEVWFGNLQGESPVLDGDKSRLFWLQIQQLLTFEGYRTRVVNPVMAFNKIDEVAYWKTRDMELVKKVKSCFDGSVKQCGKCQSCFRKYVAFKANGVDISDQFPVMEFEEHKEKYKRVMTEALEKGDYSHYSPARIKATLDVIENMK